MRKLGTVWKIQFGNTVWQNTVWKNTVGKKTVWKIQLWPNDPARNQVLEAPRHLVYHKLFWGLIITWVYSGAMNIDWKTFVFSQWAAWPQNDILQEVKMTRRKTWHSIERERRGLSAAKMGKLYSHIHNLKWFPIYMRFDQVNCGKLYSHIHNLKLFPIYMRFDQVNCGKLYSHILITWDLARYLKLFGQVRQRQLVSCAASSAPRICGQE